MYPNPAQSEVHLYFSATSETSIKVELYDETGKLLYEKTSIAKQGNNDLVLEHDALQYIGVYYVYLTIDGNKIMQKLLIEE